MASRVKLISRGIQDLLDGGGGVREAMRPRAERVADALRADPHDDTGAFEAGITVTEDHTDRLRFKIGSTDFKGHILEANYGLHSRALDSAGGS